jgi:hypothetical protein
VELPVHPVHPIEAVYALGDSLTTSTKERIISESALQQLKIAPILHTPNKRLRQTAGGITLTQDLISRSRNAPHDIARANPASEKANLEFEMHSLAQWR